MNLRCIEAEADDVRHEQHHTARSDRPI
jgi:hypothetical protein